MLKATEQSCIACHGDRHKDTFEKWKLGIELSLGDAETAYKNAREALEEASAGAGGVRKKATDLLTGAEADLKLVKTGNGLHNVAYAIELLDAVTARCREAVEALADGMIAKVAFPRPRCRAHRHAASVPTREPHKPRVAKSTTPEVASGPDSSSQASYPCASS